MTSANIHPAIRVWLARKGFTDDKKIEGLASKGSNLAHACLIVSRFSSRYPTEFKAIADTPVGPVAPRKKGMPKRQASEQKIEAIKELYRRVSGSEIEDGIVELLASTENSPEIHETAPTLADNSTGTPANDDSHTHHLTKEKNQAPVSTEKSPENRKSVSRLIDNSTNTQAIDDSHTHHLTTPNNHQQPHTLAIDTQYEHESQDNETEDNDERNEYENFQIGGVNVVELDQGLELAEEITATTEGFDVTIDENGRSRIALTPKPQTRSSHLVRRWSSTGTSSIQVRRTQAELHTGRGYSGHWIVPQTKDPTYLVFVHSMLRLVITNAPMEGHRGKAMVKFELAEGRHEKVWALEALATDPGRRLAIRVTLSYQDGKTLSFYPQTDSEDAPYKANTVMDWLDGDGDEVSAHRPRRYIFIQKQMTGVPEHLQKFVKGGYTDGLGRYFKQFPRERKEGWTR
ncbi:hypothetical protein ZTR_10065 [Talaromyces verruculosus]|nr:hypothetical protein ZTR_10065 [Talaromyces verruculosus]